MKLNSITVTAHLANGSVNEILYQASPSAAIEEYLFPDMRPPVDFLSISATDENGKSATIIVENGKTKGLSGKITISD